MEKVTLPLDDPSKLLGKGSFSDVYLANDGKSALKLVVKKDSLGKGTTTFFDTGKVHPNSRRKFSENIGLIYELSLTKLLDHENIMKTYGPFLTSMKTKRGKPKEYYGVRLELLSTSLDKILYSGTKTRLSGDQKKSLVSQLFNAVHYLGQVGIVHRDIKPANIMLNDKGVLKLADFGSMCPATSFEGVEFDHNDEGGTVNYKPPEFLVGFNGYQYGNSFDLWAAGAVVVEIYTSHPRFTSPGIPYAGVMVAQPLGVLTEIMKCVPVEERELEFSGDTKQDERGLMWFNDHHKKIPYIGNDNKLETRFKVLVGAGWNGDYQPEMADLLVNKVLVFRRSKRDRNFLNHPFFSEYGYKKREVSVDKGAVKEFVGKIKDILD